MRTAVDRKQGNTAVWLLGQIEEFITLNDMPNDGCAFGWYVSQDRSLVTRLRDGGDVTTTKMDEILAFMQNPATIIPRGNRKGELKALNLKPLTIEQKELP